MSKNTVQQQPNRRPSYIQLIGFLKCFLCGLVCFYLGISVGRSFEPSCICEENPVIGNLRAGGALDSSGEMSEKIKAMGALVNQHQKNEDELTIELNRSKGVISDLKKKISDQNVAKEKKGRKEETKDDQYHQKLFVPRHTGRFAAGMTFVDRDEFASRFDTGVPMDPSGWANDQVFILYSDTSAMPSEDAVQRSHESGLEGLSVEDATKNCRNLHIVLNAEGRKQQCVAIMAQYESFHIQKFMRMSNGKTTPFRNIDMNLPLRAVNRNMMLSGEKTVQTPEKKSTTAFWNMLIKYLGSIEGVLNDLRPIAKSVASKNSHNTIIVMVCNYGHSEMMMNFVCNAHAKGKETQEALQSVLIFATDIETHKLAQGLGISSFYSPAVFGDVPAEAADEYGDSRYSRIMMSKVYCVHLISQLGYDLIFQDVDIVWYKDPIPFFHSEVPDKNNVSVMEWDMIFQDDGARSLFFAPYSANTGFYFARNNKLTTYFFNQMLMLGDSILSIGSHQSALIILLVEQASLHGLRIKTWNRMKDEFPGGHTYHSRNDYMKKLILNKNSTDGRGLIETVGDKIDGVDPYIFHMSWTLNKDNKLKFFQQFGEWYLKDQCNAGSAKLENTAIKNPTISSCCAAKPLVKCHFKDKPSMIPCPDAPSMDAAKPSFW